MQQDRDFSYINLLKTTIQEQFQLEFWQIIIQNPYFQRSDCFLGTKKTFKGKYTFVLHLFIKYI